MKRNVESFLNDTIRSPMEMFSVKKLHGMLQKKRVKISLEELKEYLENHPLVVPLDKNLYITRAGLFTGYVFSFKPTRYEIENNFFITGHRCLPFVDPDMLPHEITFRYKGMIIPGRICEVQTSEIFPLYALFGEEFAPQYIAFDPANQESDFSACDYEFPSKLFLTVTSMKKIYQIKSFQYGDRIVCRVHDWNSGIIDINVLSEKKENPFEESLSEKIRNNWFETAENGLLKVFDSYGPCDSIEKQLMYMYLTCHKDLCVPECGSAEELLERSKKIAVEYYGVESRIWRRNEDIPAVGPWNDEAEQIPKEEYEKSMSGIIPLPDCIIHAFILDSLYRKEPDCTELVKRILPEQVSVNEYGKVLLILHLMQKRDIIRKQYNWFADYVSGKLRQKALSLYLRIFALICDLDASGIDIPQLPQQPLVIVSQLLGHVSRLITSFSGSMPISEKDFAAMRISLDGMELSFEESEEILRGEIKKHRSDGFFVIKESKE